MRPRPAARLAVSLLTVLILVLSACGSDSVDGSGAVGGEGGGPDADAPTVVVTYSVLGAAVAELVGDEAEVVVIMASGVDPHDYRPSPRDVETIANADFVVANGLDLEEGMLAPIEEAEGNGVPVFHATDHIDVRRYGAAEPTDGHGHDDDGHGHDDEKDDDGHGHDDDDGHGHAEEGGEDPHFWVDPIAMADAMDALATELEEELGLDLAERNVDLQERLAELDERTEATLAVIPDERRVLVTGHESMGYFAARYDFALVGALIPSLTTQAAPSASDLAELKDQIEEYEVPVIFNEIGTSPAVAQAVADETGAVVIELPSHNLPDDGSYFTFIDEIAGKVVEGLAP
jgi:zinc/manganese transport system substrate-binding protein